MKKGISIALFIVGVLLLLFTICFYICAFNYTGFFPEDAGDPSVVSAAESASLTAAIIGTVLTLACLAGGYFVLRSSRK